MDPTQILVDNLREALRHLQRYLSLATGLSLSLLLLELAVPQAGQETVSLPLPGLAVAVDPTLTKVLLIAVYIAVAVLVLATGGHAKNIASAIKNRQIRNAAAMFPTVATSTDPWLRVLGILLPALIFFGFLVAHWWSNEEREFGIYFMGFLFGCLPFAMLLVELREPFGSLNARRPRTKRKQ